MSTKTKRPQSNLTRLLHQVQDSDLSATAKNAFAAVARSMDTEKLVCHVSMKTIAKRMSQSFSTAQRGVRELQKAGYLTVFDRRRQNRCNEYRGMLVEVTDTGHVDVVMTQREGPITGQTRGPTTGQTTGHSRGRPQVTSDLRPQVTHDLSELGVPTEPTPVEDLVADACLEEAPDEDVAALYESIYGTGSSTPASSREEVLGEEPPSGDEPVLPYATGSSASRPATDDSEEVPDWVTRLSWVELREARNTFQISWAVFTAEVKRRDGLEVTN